MQNRFNLPVLGGFRDVEVEFIDARREKVILDQGNARNEISLKGAFHFILIIEGRAEFKAPRWVHSIKSGEGLLVFPEEIIRSNFQGSNACRFYSLHFQFQGVPMRDLHEIFPRIISQSDNSKRLGNTLDSLIDASIRHDNHLIASEFCEFLLKLTRIPLRRSVQNISPTVRDALSFIHENAINHPSRNEIASSVGISPNHLSRLVRLDTGRALTQHLREARVRIAKDLMQASKLNISETAEQLGIDVQSFSKLFKSVTGKTPNQYKRETITST